MSNLVERAKSTSDLPHRLPPTTHRETEASSIGVPVLIFREKIAYNRFRRTFDVVGALIALLISLPILFAASAAVLLEDGRPVLFRQRRVGRFGKLFTMYKIRTMRKEKCVDEFSPTSRSDPRITKAGYWLRKSSIDEIPQLVNIVRGEMTFVGPRPEMPFHVRQYKAWQHLRHLVTPGITGFWQTTCRSKVPLHLPEATLIDIEYIRKASHATDIAVLLKTIQVMLSTENAY